jgi:hypothetical protein
MKVNTAVALALTDGFISCWDEKFRSNRIRPETAIRKYIDPPGSRCCKRRPSRVPERPFHRFVGRRRGAFPLLGEKFAYTDSVETRYGLPARRFTSSSKRRRGWHFAVLRRHSLHGRH